MPSTTLRHRGWNFSVCFWRFYNTKFTEICWNNSVFEFPKKYQRCSRKHTDFNAIEIMCLRQAQAPRWELRMCLLQAQAACNEIIGGWACRSHCVWIFCICFNITKSTEILWNDSVFEFSKEHQRCSIEYTDFNTIEIMCLRQAQAPSVVINNTVIERSRNHREA